MNTIVCPTAQDEICYFCWEPETDNNTFINEPICMCKGSLKIHWNCYRILDDFRYQESEGNDFDNLFGENHIDNNICKICMSEYKIHLDDDCFYTIRNINGIDYHKIYNLDGSLLEEGPTDIFDYKHGHWKVYSKGKLLKEGTYLHGIHNGLWKMYDDITGSLIAEGYFEQNMHHGPWKYYYPSGQLKEEGSYVYSLQNGIWKTYYESGRLQSEGTYENGEKMDDWKTYLAGKKRKRLEDTAEEPIAKRLRSSNQ